MIGPSASHWQVGASLQNQLSISDLFFLVILDFVFSLWKFVEKKMLGNILLEMVTLEYFLVRCILGASASHWQVVVPTKPSIHFSFLIFFVDFIWNSVTFSWQGNSGGNLYTFDILFHSKKIYHFQKLRVTNYCGSLMEWSLNLLNVHVCFYFLVISIYNSSNKTNTTLFKFVVVETDWISSHCYFNTGTCFSIPYVSITLIVIVK